MQDFTLYHFYCVEPVAERTIFLGLLEDGSIQFQAKIP
jgi:hypothetical protein